MKTSGAIDSIDRVTSSASAMAATSSLWMRRSRGMSGGAPRVLTTRKTSRTRPALSATTAAETQANAPSPRDVFAPNASVHGTIFPHPTFKIHPDATAETCAAMTAGFSAGCSRSGRRGLASASALRRARASSRSRRTRSTRASLVSPPAVSLPRLKRYLSSGGARRCDAYVWTVPTWLPPRRTGLTVSSPFPMSRAVPVQQCLPRRRVGTIEWLRERCHATRQRLGKLHLMHHDDGSRKTFTPRFRLHTLKGALSFGGLHARQGNNEKEISPSCRHRCRLSLRGVASKRSSRLRL